MQWIRNQWFTQIVYIRFFIFIEVKLNFYFPRIRRLQCLSSFHNHIKVIFIFFLFIHNRFPATSIKQYFVIDLHCNLSGNVLFRIFWISILLKLLCWCIINRKAHAPSAACATDFVITLNRVEWFLIVSSFSIIGRFLQ